MSYEELREELEKENERHQRAIKELEMQIKLKQNIEEELVKENEEERQNGEEEKIEVLEVEPQKVYFVPESKKKEKKQGFSFGNLFKNLFGKKKKTAKHKKNDNFYFLPKQEKNNTMEKSFDENLYLDEYSSVIHYAKQLKSEKEKHEELKEKYIDALKVGNIDKVNLAKNKLWESQNSIRLAESFLKNKIKDVKRSSLDLQEKRRILNEVYEIANIKLKDGPAHMKKAEETVKEEPKNVTIEDLKTEEEKINSYKHFTNLQKEKMLQELHEEISNLTNDEFETDNKKKL